TLASSAEATRKVWLSISLLRGAIAEPGSRVRTAAAFWATIACIAAPSWSLMSARIACIAAPPRWFLISARMAFTTAQPVSDVGADDTGGGAAAASTAAAWGGPFDVLSLDASLLEVCCFAAGWDLLVCFVADLLCD